MNFAGTVTGRVRFGTVWAFQRFWFWAVSGIVGLSTVSANQVVVRAAESVVLITLAVLAPWQFDLVSGEFPNDPFGLPDKSIGAESFSKIFRFHEAD